ncbi:MAG TPA: tetratricopeptide repeat protein [Nitrospiraceae bacterium]|nr:tetratricopeptide repeat protein [Nitrospiraceae bacterium]
MSPEAKKSQHLDRATSYAEKGQYQEAIIEYRNVTQADPNDGDAHYRLALVHLKIGDITNLQAAFSELNRALELDTTNRDARLRLGELYLLGNEPVKARKQAELVLVSAPQDTDGLVLKGRSLIHEQQYTAGIAELKKSIELNPKNLRTYIDLARAYVFSKNLDAAEATLEQALTIDPRSTEILAALGDFRVTTGKPDQAESFYKQALDIAPQTDELYFKLAELYQRIGKPGEAEATLHKLATIKPTDEKPHVHIGDFYTSIGQHDKALTSYLRAIEVNPNSVIARDKLIAHYLDTGKTHEAEAKVKDILGKNSTDLMGRFFNARLLLANNNAKEAIPILQGVVRDEPRFAGAHHFLGVAFMRERQISQARGAFADAVKANPNLPESRTALAELYLAEGSSDLALEQAQVALHLNPRNVQAAIISGDAYLRKGDLVKSRQIFEAIAQGLPKEAIGPYRLGLVARAEKNDAKALAYFEEALDRKPETVDALTQIAMIKIGQGKPNDARERVNKQIEASPKNPLFYNLLGRLWMDAKNTGQAEVSFKKAIELDTTLLPAYLNLGQLYYQTGKTDQAAMEYEAVLEKDSKVIQAHMMLGLIHEFRKEHAKAQAHYETILKLDPQFAPAANNLAWLLGDHGGNLDVALSYAQTAREQKPDDPYIADTLGWLYYKKNAPILAVSLLKEALEKLPNEPVVHFHYGMAQQKNGDAVGAKKSLQAALKLNPTFPGSEEARKTLDAL